MEIFHHFHGLDVACLLGCSFEKLFHLTGQTFHQAVVLFYAVLR